MVRTEKREQREREKWNREVKLGPLSNVNGMGVDFMKK